MTHTAPPAERPPVLGTLLFVVAASMVLALAMAGRFHGFKIYDDAYMFVRYADHIIAGEGMAWNVGEGPVYGATSLAYVFALVPFRLLMPDNPAAAIFSCSFFWGLMFVALLVRLALRDMAPNANQRRYLLGFVFVVLLATSATLRVHFASGMETTFALSYLVLCIGGMERLRQGRGNAWLLGALLGIAWWIRPDLLLFTLGVPVVTALLTRDRVARGRWLRASLASLAGLVLCLLAARWVAGSMLPVSFLAKNTGLYGPLFAEEYKAKAYLEFIRFMGRAWPAIIVLGLGVYVKWGRLRAAYSPMDMAAMAMVAAFAGYYLFMVLQVMGHGQRFYYPLLPWLVYLALREFMELGTSLRLGPELQFKRVPRGLERAGLAFLAGLLLYFGIDYGLDLRGNPYRDRIAVFDALQTYHDDLTDYWPRLDALAHVPPGLRIATTEVGMPAALYPQSPIDDLAGLNSPKLIAAGLDAQAVLDHSAADLIFLPHRHYAKLSGSLSSSADFAAAYLTIPDTSLHASMGVAIRRDGPQATRLMDLFDPVGKVVP